MKEYSEKGCPYIFKVFWNHVPHTKLLDYIVNISVSCSFFIDLYENWQPTFTICFHCINCTEWELINKSPFVEHRKKAFPTLSELLHKCISKTTNINYANLCHLFQTRSGSANMLVLTITKLCWQLDKSAKQKVCFWTFIDLFKSSAGPRARKWKEEYKNWEALKKVKNENLHHTLSPEMCDLNFTLCA